MKRSLENILVYDGLKPGEDPTYEWDIPENVWYLGFLGELASEIKCLKITLPMLLKKDFDWELELKNALLASIQAKPQKHVDTLEDAYIDFSREMYNYGYTDDYNQHANIWFSNIDTYNKLHDNHKIDFIKCGYPKPIFFDADRCHIDINLGPKIIMLVPNSEIFGYLAINETCFNFLFFPKKIFVYRLKEYKIISDA